MKFHRPESDPGLRAFREAHSKQAAIGVVVPLWVVCAVASVLAVVLVVLGMAVNAVLSLGSQSRALHAEIESESLKLRSAFQEETTRLWQSLETRVVYHDTHKHAADGSPPIVQDTAPEVRSAASVPVTGGNTP